MRRRRAGYMVLWCGEPYKAFLTKREAKKFMDYLGKECGLMMTDIVKCWWEPSAHEA